MRFKIILSVHPEVFGKILPICYQYELSSCVSKMITGYNGGYEYWLERNGLVPQDNIDQKLYAVSNLYIPKIRVEGDRLDIVVPRVQFWISFMPEVDTEEFVRSCFEQHNMLIGDKKSKVLFQVDGVEKVSPVEFEEEMEYTCLSPILVMGVRPNNSVEYLSPDNPYFSQFLVEELIERYQRLYKKPYEGSHECSLEVMGPVKRKGVYIRHFTRQEIKVIGYMFKFMLKMDPILQKLAYETGLGDKVNYGFGYLELRNKREETPKADIFDPKYDEIEN